MVLKSPSHVMLINCGTKEQLKATSFKRSILKSIIFHLISLLCVGIPYVLVLWNEVLGVYWQYKRCPFEFADVLILKDIHGQKYAVYIEVEDVKESFPLDFSISTESDEVDPELSEKTKLCKNSSKCVRYFTHHHIKYLWKSKEKRYEMLSGLDRDIQLSDFHNEYTGFSTAVQESRLELYGPNSIEVEVISYWRILKDEVLNPFYLFEIFSVVVWIVDEYIYYAVCVLIMSFVSLGIALYEIRRQSEVLRDMATSCNAAVVSVCRSGEVFENVVATKLVPGDVIVIPPTGCAMPCDAVLVAGTCIVNESMLTGESVPVTKTAAPELDEPYSIDLHNKHTLFCGTTVLQTRYYGHDKVLAVVTQTGFTTAKGELVRSILYPKPIGFKFYMDSIKFMLILLFVAVCGVCYSVYIYITKEATVGEIIIRACDMLTIVVPPAMPAAMTVGIVYAQNRLKNQGIFCISPQRINVCGKVNLFCFDKTGTLTEGGLDFWGVIPRSGTSFGNIIRDPSLNLEQKDPILVTLAACHTLTLIDGELIGDPLEIKMFESTGWILEEPRSDATRYDVMAPTVVKPVSRDMFVNLHGMDFAETAFEMPFQVGIVRQFPFSSTLQRMSVVIRALGNRSMEVLCKGSPEKVTSLCLPETVPTNLSTVLRSYAIRGFRVLALAHRVLDRKVTWHQMHRMKRNQLECNLEFLGLLVMHNTLKPESKTVIKELRRANIHCVMITGDNLLTAINVARDCDMLPVGERVILVTASPPGNGQPIKVQFSLAEMYDCYEADGFLNSATSSEESLSLFSSSWHHATASRLETVEKLVRNRSQIIEVEQGVSPRYHFATCGKTWSLLRKYAPDLIPRLMVRGTVFARMAPDQKTQLIEELQHLDYVVGMCGDGANDCGALKAAHVGVSLSEAEASAAAPFTSKTSNISCVPKLIREGRCALVTSFGVFKYMALYSLIQFISVMILYSLRTTLGDYMFLYHDLVITTTVAFLMGKTAPYDHIVAQRPRGSLMGLANMVSIVIQIALTAAVQLAGLLILMLQPWYEPVHPVGDEDIIPCWEVTVIFYISSFQYLILALAFSYGPPYRQPFYTNTLFLLSLVVLSAFNLILTFLPISPLASFFEVIGIKVEPDVSSTFNEEENMYLFRFYIVLIVLLNAALSFLAEYLASRNVSFKKFTCQLFTEKVPKGSYKMIEEELLEEPNWPPVDDGEFFHNMSM